MPVELLWGTTPTTTATKTKTTKPATSPSTSTPSPAAPAAPSTPTLTGGNAVAGAAVFASAGCGNCHSLPEIRGLGITADLNQRHPGPFDNGALTQTQLADLAAYIAGG